MALGHFGFGDGEGAVGAVGDGGGAAAALVDGKLALLVIDAGYPHRNTKKQEGCNEHA